MKGKITWLYEKNLSSDSSEGYREMGKWRKDRHANQSHPPETRTIAEECNTIREGSGEPRT